MEKQNYIIGDINVYYINLDRSTERNEIIIKQFQENGIKNYKRVQAIDGQKPNDIGKNYEINKNMTPTTIACALSHIKAIKQAYDDGCEMALIMEDDSNFEYIKHKSIPLKSLVNIYSKYDVFQLVNVGGVNTVKNAFKMDNIVTTGHLDGAVCYLIKREAMKRSIETRKLEVSENIIYKLNNPCYTNRPYFTYFYTKDFDSTIVHYADTKNNGKTHVSDNYADNSKKAIDELYRKTTEINNNKIVQNIPIYYINLDRSTDRNESMKKKFSDTGIRNYTRITAVDGKTLDINEIKKKYDVHKDMNNYTIACTLSHIKAISQAYNDGCDIAIIMEDDCVMDYLKYHEYTINEIVELHPNKDLFQLTYNSHKILDILYSENLVSDGYQDCTACYLVNRKGMKHIMEMKQLYVADICLYKNNNSCYVNRPFFSYEYTYETNSTIHFHNKINNENNYENTSKRTIDTYYKVLGLWDKIFCINLGVDLKKYKSMIKFCRIFNKKPENFFHAGFLGNNIPDNDDYATLIESGIYDEHVRKENIKYGTIGLNYMQRFIFKKSLESNYDRILLLEDDIYFDKEWFLEINDFYDHHKISDIFYLGAAYNDVETDESNFFYQISKNKKRDLLEIKNKNNISKKVCIGGAFALSLSKKAIKTICEVYDVITTVSDIMIFSLTVNQTCTFQNKLSQSKFIKDYGLTSYSFKPNLFNVNMNKISLTCCDSLPRFLQYSEFTDRFYRLNKIKFKISNNISVKIFQTESITTYFAHVTNPFKKQIKHCIVKEISEADLCLISSIDSLNISKMNNSSILVIFGGESYESKVQENINRADILIQSTQTKYNGKLVYYYPQLLNGYHERRKSIDSYDIPKKTKFCSYMYSYDVPHRVEIFKVVSKYKKVDALGKSQKNVTRKDDRFTYDKNYTYNDLGVLEFLPYKFNLAFENKNVVGYVTEKILNALIAGCIPIYWGHSSVFNIINKKRVIYCGDYTNLEDINKRISEIDNNDDLFNEVTSEPWFVGQKDASVNSAIEFLDKFDEGLSEFVQKMFNLTPKSGKNILCIYDKNNDIDQDKIKKNNMDIILIIKYKDLEHDLGSHVSMIKKLSDFTDIRDNIFIYDPNSSDDIVVSKGIKGNKINNMHYLDKYSENYFRFSRGFKKTEMKCKDFNIIHCQIKYKHNKKSSITLNIPLS